MLGALVVCFCVLGLPKEPGAEELVPRVVIALYNGGNIQDSYIHTVAEMPLNHLGLIVEYHDVHDPLPTIASRKDVLGVLTWFMGALPIDAYTYFKWAGDVVAAGKKFVILGSPGLFSGKTRDTDASLENKFLAQLGLRITEHWVDRPFDVRYDFRTPEMFLATGTYEWLRPPYTVAHSIMPENRVHLSTQNPDRPDDDADLIVTGPFGGYAPDDYIFRTNMIDGDEVAQWLINPFEFFRLAFATDEIPKPDITTIAGRRLYYSSIDGDGWNNVTQIEDYRGKGVLSSEVILDKVVKPYPDMPVMLAIIAADIDPEWAAADQSRAVAKEFLAQPQVEAGTHTYSHPFDWQFFNDYDWKKEIPFLPLYSTPTWKPTEADLRAAPKARPRLPNGYVVPRAYAREPFDIHKEITGSIKEISALLPAGKKVEVLAWPGNCSPSEEVVRMTREAHVQNINGGDSRFDAEYPAYASEEPIGRQVGKERQIYNATSNEDLYTNQWSENFNAFEYLKTTLKNSETPIRLEPISIYYHIYSGEREASLKALLGNIEYARAQDIAPLTVSAYTRIAEGFYSTTLIMLAPEVWRVAKRGALETIRFDHKTLKSVDFAKSKGVIGERYLQGSLYVYLDAAVSEPVIALHADGASLAPAPEPIPYLEESRWPVSDVHARKTSLEFNAQGFGEGEMVWRMPADGPYRVTAGDKTETVEAVGGFLTLKLPSHDERPIHVTIKGT